MKKFRVQYELRLDCVVEVDAEDAEDARRLAEDLGRNPLSDKVEIFGEDLDIDEVEEVPDEEACDVDRSAR